MDEYQDWKEITEQVSDMIIIHPRIARIATLVIAVP